VQKAALQECVRAPALPVCTPVTLTHVVTVATGVRSAVQNLDIIHIIVLSELLVAGIYYTRSHSILKVYCERVVIIIPAAKIASPHNRAQAKQVSYALVNPTRCSFLASW